MLNTAVGLGWNVDFALCNIGGLRSYMPKGHIVKWGKMLSVYVWNILVNNQYG
jgi:hypothetical protein